MSKTKRWVALGLLAGFILSVTVASGATSLNAQAPQATPSATSAKPTIVRHFSGKITSVNTSNQAFTIDTGTKKLVVVVRDTTKLISFSTGRKSGATFSDFKVDGRVTAIGEVKGSTLTAKLIAIVPTRTIKRHADRGTITALSNFSISFEPVTNKNSTATANVTSTTVYTKKVDGKLTRASFSSLEVGDRISFVGTVDDKGVITAKIAHITPSSSSSKTVTP